MLKRDWLQSGLSIGSFIKTNAGNILVCVGLEESTTDSGYQPIFRVIEIHNADDEDLAHVMGGDSAGWMYFALTDEALSRADFTENVTLVQTQHKRPNVYAVLKNGNYRAVNVRSTETEIEQFSCGFWGTLEVTPKLMESYELTPCEILDAVTNFDFLRCDVGDVYRTLNGNTLTVYEISNNGMVLFTLTDFSNREPDGFICGYDHDNVPTSFTQESVPCCIDPIYIPTLDLEQAADKA